MWHRDLKPENVLIADDGRAAVTDFGIAHFGEEYLVTHVETQPGERLANFAYAAPEQCVKGAIVNQRADIFALGLLLNEMVTGNLPRGASFKTIGDVDPQFDFLDEVVHVMMSNQPSSRPANAGEARTLIETHSMAADSKRALKALEQKPIAQPALPQAKQYEIRGVDHLHGNLVLKLNEAPPRDWIVGLQKVGGPYTTSFSPRMVQVQGDELWLPDQGHFNQENVNMTKQYVERANAWYLDRAREQAQRAAAEAERLRREELDAAARRLKVRTSIKI